MTAREIVDQPEETQRPSRSSFILVGVAGVFAVLGAVFFALTARYLQRADPGAQHTRPLRVALESLRFRDGVAGPIAYDMGVNGIPGIFLVRQGSGLIALEQTCTHLGCAVSWIPADQRFECPCHGSQFDRAGNVVAGPAPYGLYRHRLKMLPGAVLIEGRL